MLENLAKEVVTLASTLAPCEVGRWTQAARKGVPFLLDQNICPLHNFHVGTELHARDGRSDCVSTGGDRASQSTQHTNPHHLALAWYDSMTLTPTSPVTLSRFALAKGNPASWMHAQPSSPFSVSE